MSEYCGRQTEAPAQGTLIKAQRDRRQDSEGQLRGRQRKDLKAEGAGKAPVQLQFSRI